MTLNKLEKILIGGIIAGVIIAGVGFISKSKIGSYVGIGGIVGIGVCGGVLTSEKKGRPPYGPYKNSKYMDD